MSTRSENPISHEEIAIPSEMVLVPKGKVLLGSTDSEIDWVVENFPHHPRTWYEDEAPQQEYPVNAYLIDKFPVTNADFQNFVDATGYISFAEKRGWGLVYTDTYWREVPNASWRSPIGYGTTIKEILNHPVIHISLQDAQAYASWAGKRLPTEIEWSRAAKNDQDSLWIWGNDWDKNNANTAEYWTQADLVDICAWKNWWKQTYREHGGMPLTTPVGMFSNNKSDFGAYDLCGNVYEITASKYDKYDPYKEYDEMYEVIFGKYIVVKGGSWMNFRFQVRNNERIAIDSLYSSFATGFRCVKDI